MSFALSFPFTTTMAEQTPQFAPPAPLELDADQREKVLTTITQLYKDRTEERISYSKQHVGYDQMFRGQIDSGRTGPWEGSANLHVQMPYWLVDSINTRLVSGIWNQTPLVSGYAVEDDDLEVFQDASALIQWSLQRKRMNARQMWSIISKMRCIHGVGVGYVTYPKSTYLYRTAAATANVQMENGQIKFDEVDNPVPVRGHDQLKRDTKYHGPVLTPLEWDDIITPIEGFNLQPVTLDNPKGCDYVGLRQWHNLSLIWKHRKSTYSYIDEDDEAKDFEWWEDNAPSQDRSGDSVTADNQNRVRVQDRHTGKQRSLSSRRHPSARSNPEFEVITWFMPWMLPNEVGELEEQECIFFASLQPKMLLGAFRLSDINWRNTRPLLELHYQRVGTRFDSMGICEIAKHLSSELDTIHNMRLDVGFSTNMPFFFYRSTSTINPEKITLRPLKGVPVDDINDVRFPQLQNVTSFYHQEETLLYSLVERVMGVTDLFLGISPTKGAAARHATGFVGTQQESMARTSETLNQDASSFSFLCHLIYDLEMQFGPPERIIRLQGREGPLSQKAQLSREELFMRGEYDFTLGANEGMFSSFIRQQQAQALMQLKATSPIIAQDMGKIWEVENEYISSLGKPNPEQFIGPKKAISAGVSKSPDEEAGEMSQMAHGPGIPTPVHPNDNDQEHIDFDLKDMGSPEFMSMGMPNYEGRRAHVTMHQQAMQQKQQAVMAGVAPPGKGQQAPPQTNTQGPALGQERIEPQLQGTGNMGAMGNAGQASGGGGVPNMEKMFGNK